MLLCGSAAPAADCNQEVLAQIARVPTGGGYATTTDAHRALSSSVEIDAGGVTIEPVRARPSYCSGATYVVLLMTLHALESKGAVRLDDKTWQALAPEPMSDGTGLWGRWNANGPGTARLFYELGLGRNFTDYAEARPGDFLKIFWNNEVGANEHGHSVIYLGTEWRDGVEYVRFWSSNKPGGYGEKAVPKSKIMRTLFSRLEYPQRFAAWGSIPPRDRYLASLLSQPSSFGEVKRLTGVQ